MTVEQAGLLNFESVAWKVEGERIEETNPDLSGYDIEANCGFFVVEPSMEELYGDDDDEEGGGRARLADRDVGEDRERDFDEGHWDEEAGSEEEEEVED